MHATTSCLVTWITTARPTTTSVWFTVFTYLYLTHHAWFSVCSHEVSQAQQKWLISAFQQSLAAGGFLHVWSLAQQLCQPNKYLFSHAESLAEGWCRQPNAPLFSPVPACVTETEMVPNRCGKQPENPQGLEIALCSLHPFSSG